MQELNRRNTATVEMVLRETNEKINNLNIRIDNLGNGLASMIERLNNLEKMILTIKANSIGTGPSVK